MNARLQISIVLQTIFNRFVQTNLC